MSIPSRSGQAVLIFKAAEHTCAIRAAEIAELVLMPELIRVPGQPGLLDGFLNLRGTAVPVVAFYRLFHDYAPEPDLHSPLIVLSHGLLALRADRVEEIVTISDAGVVPLVARDSLSECAEGQFYSGDLQVTLLSPGLLLLHKERICIADLQARAQLRLEGLEAEIE